MVKGDSPEITEQRTDVRIPSRKFDPNKKGLMTGFSVDAGSGETQKKNFVRRQILKEQNDEDDDGDGDEDEDGDADEHTGARMVR